MIATAHAAQQTLAIVSPISRPYLATFGAPALRFHEAPPPPPPQAKAIAVGPPVAASAPAVAEVSLANEHAAASTPPMPLEHLNPAPATPQREPAENPASVPTEKPAPSKALPILPDDTRGKIQSQDFLPLFRFPGSATSAEDVTIITPGIPAPPSPSTLPPSSATYRQY